MYQEINNFLQENAGKNTSHLAVKVPEKLTEALKKKANKLNVDASSLMRTAIAIFVMPEFLEQLTDDEATNWVSQEGCERIQYQFTEKYKKYKDIIEFAQFATEKTQELRDQFMQAEVEYMDKVIKRQRYRAEAGGLAEVQDSKAFSREGAGQTERRNQTEE